MTYAQLIDWIRQTSFAYPNINSFERDFSSLNREDETYSAAILQDLEHSRPDTHNMIYSFYLGYADLLTEDRKNEDDIYSAGIQFINHVINTIYEDYDVSIGNYVTVTSKFLADCAVVYATVNITIPMEGCLTEYGQAHSFNDDYNDDFDASTK